MAKRNTGKNWATETENLCINMYLTRLLGLAHHCHSIMESVMKKNELFIERRPQGDYAVCRANSERASAVRPTQSEAIQRARELEPNATPLVERVRHTNQGHTDQWRKP